MAKILIVDDELSILEVLNTILIKGGYTVSSASSSEEALRLLRDDVFDLLITDVRLPDMDGISLLSKARELQSHIAVIIMTAYAEVETAVRAMREGAFDYITKPFKFEELMLTIERALSYETALAENKVLKTTLHTEYHFDCIIGDSDPMLAIYRLIEKIARTNSTALILGESGTGKELVAKALHESSSRVHGAFVKVNCAAMPETLLESELFGYVKGAFTGANSNRKGLFETAHGGTLFLDEIGSIPMSMQMKLLRVLQEKEIRRVGGTEDIAVDVRVIAATNENLEKKTAKGEFREDLFFRLSVIPIIIPPLRERKEDIPKLITHFLGTFEKENKVKVGISSDAVKALVAYEWPGNIRELENLINRLATLNDSGTVEYDELPMDIRGFSSDWKGVRNRVAGFSHAPHPDIVAAGTNPKSSGEGEILPLKKYMLKHEKDYINKAIALCGGSKEAAADFLGISLATLYRKIDK